MTDNKHGYKAYEPGLVCRGYQYEEGKTYKKNGHGIPVCVKSAQIDGKIIKADTWYKLTDGEFVEVADE